MEKRKFDHITLAAKGQTGPGVLDSRFYYEPALKGHPQQDTNLEVQFLGKKMRAPLWISSMTGGTELAYQINRNLAYACRKFGLGMGLGSCRPILEGRPIDDFDLRGLIGNDTPFYANIGVAQVEFLYREGNLKRLEELGEKLKVDGIIIHLNPLQEWVQPEGDRYYLSPIDLIDECLNQIKIPFMVKEVGQGFGPRSLKELMKRPLAAIDMAGFGGTNFTKIETLRNAKECSENDMALARVGHTVDEMVTFVNQAIKESESWACQEFIVSGGIKTTLDGYYYLKKAKFKSIYGLASRILRPAMEGEKALEQFIQAEIDTLSLAEQMLTIRDTQDDCGN